MKEMTTESNAGIRENRVPITIIIGLIACCFVAGSIALLFHKDTFIAKRKAFQYMIISSIGLLFYLRDTLEIAWTYPAYITNVSTTYVYYLIAVPVHFLPVLVRSWRIYCVYKSTPTWKCTMEPITSRRRRGHKWMFIRIFVLYLPWAGISIGLRWNQNIPYYVYIGLNGIVAIANFVLTVLLYRMRNDLRPKYLDETTSLLTYSLTSLIEWIWANTIYILALLMDTSGIMVVYMYVDVFLIFNMWLLTTGKTLYRVWARRDVVGDTKPELGARDIQKALQRAESNGSALSVEMTSTSDMECESDVQKT
jgi:hypothetical protein